MIPQKGHETAVDGEESHRRGKRWSRVRQLWSGGFTARLLRLFVGLLVISCVWQFVVAYVSWNNLLEHHYQQRHWLLAEQVARRVADPLRERADWQILEDAIAEVNSPRPLADFYVADSAGTIRFNFSYRPPLRATLPVKQIERFLEGRSEHYSSLLKIPDPIEPRYRRVFSAARLQVAGHDSYLVALFHSAELNASRLLLAQSYVVRNSIAALAIGMLCCMAVGLVLFRTMTLPYERLIEAVRKFRSGDFETRFPDDSGHEIGELGGMFNEMADALAAHIGTLEHTDRLRRELVAAVSHDLRTPLTSIRSFIELAKQKNHPLTSEQVQVYLDNSLSSIDSLTRLIDDLFELSKLEATQRTPDLAACELDQLVSDSLRTFRGVCEERSLNLREVYEEQLPLILIDPTMIERAMGNLLQNAIRYTPDHGTIAVSVARAESQLMVTVADTGCGIPRQALGNIFDRYYQVKGKDEHKGGGAGLGLAIVKRIVELHHGSITVESELGVGTMFTFSLPLSQERRPSSELPVGAPPCRTKGKR